MGAKWQIPFLITEIYFTKYDLTWNITCFFMVDSKFCTKLIVYSSVSWKFEFCVWISKQLWTCDEKAAMYLPVSKHLDNLFFSDQELQTCS